jgi:hypothetical protein
MLIEEPFSKESLTRDKWEPATYPGLPHLPRLRALSVEISGLDDEWLRQCPLLEALDWSISAEDRDTSGIESLTQLRYLKLYWGYKARLPVPVLEANRQLEYLHLAGRSFVDDELKSLRKVPSLRKLQISSLKLEGDGLSHLANLQRLEVLVLNASRASGLGLDHLPALKSLRVLHLSSGPLDDANIPALRRQPALRKLLFDYAPKSGFEELQEALPNCSLMDRQGKPLPRPVQEKRKSPSF